MNKTEKEFKNTFLWKAQYQPRINMIKKVSPEIHKKLIAKPLNQQIQIIDNLQAKGVFS